MSIVLPRGIVAAFAAFLLSITLAGNSEAQLQGSAGNVRVNISWNGDVDLDLYVTDPCDQTFGYDAHTREACRGFTGEWDHDDTGLGAETDNPNQENIVWTNGAPVGEYSVHVNYFDGSIVTNYTIRVFYGNREETYTGSIGPDALDLRPRHIATFFADETVNFPVVSFDLTSSSVDENVGTHNVTVNLSPAPRDNITLGYVLSGSADEGDDYNINGAGTIEVPSDVESVNVALRIEDDSVVENSETVILTLVEGSGYTIGNESHTLTIEDDDDEVGVQLSLEPNPVPEGSSITVTATLSAASDSNVRIPLTLTAGTAEADDYGALEYITIVEGSTSGTGQITTTDDADADDETFTVALGDLPETVLAGDRSSVEVTVVDDDSHVHLSVSALTIEEGGEGSYTVVLTGEPDGLVTVMPSSENADVAVYPESLSFHSDNWDMPQAVMVSAAQDDDVINDTATITHAVTGLDDVTDGGAVTVTVREVAGPSEREVAVVSEAIATVAATAVSNVTTNIGARFSAARGGASVSGTNLSLAGHSIAQSRQWEVMPRSSNRDGKGDIRTLSSDELLRSAVFQIALGAAESEGAQSHAPIRWTAWGRGDLQAFRSKPNRGAGYDGDLQAGYLGLDVQIDDRWMAGIAISQTAAAADYTVEGGTGQGKMDVSLSSLLPYVRFAPNANSELWAILGTGKGEIENVRPGTASSEEEASDLTLRMAAAGGRRTLETDGSLGWAVLGDMNFGRVETADGVQAVAGLTVDTWRARLGVEGSYTTELENGGVATAFMEVAGRYDGGGDDSEAGVEVSPGLYFSDPRSGIGVELRGRALVLHSAENYEEYGLSATASFSPRSDGLGPSLSLTPRWGEETAGADRLWRESGFDQLAVRTNDGHAMSLDARAGYGIRTMRGILTPFGEFGIRDEDSRRLRVGTRFERIHADPGALSLELAAEWRRTPERDAEQRAGVTARVRF